MSESWVCEGCGVEIGLLGTMCYRCGTRRPGSESGPVGRSDAADGRGGKAGSPLQGLRVTLGVVGLVVSVPAFLMSWVWIQALEIESSAGPMTLMFFGIVASLVLIFYNPRDARKEGWIILAAVALAVLIGVIWAQPV